MGKIILKYNPKTGKVEQHSESTLKSESGVLIKTKGPGLKWTSRNGQKLK